LPVHGGLIVRIWGAGERLQRTPLEKQSRL
jgi:hypothetical protein